MMDQWICQSNRQQQIALAVGCMVIGLALAVGFRHFHGAASSNALAGFLLGVLLLGIGVAALLANGRQTIVIDPAVRCIIVEETSMLNSTQRVIPFADITDIHIGYLGTRSNYVTTYYLTLLLRSGEEYPLFAAGYCYAGASDRSVVEGWRQRLQEYVSSAQE